MTEKACNLKKLGHLILLPNVGNLRHKDTTKRCQETVVHYRDRRLIMVHANVKYFNLSYKYSNSISVCQYSIIFMVID